MEYSGSNVLIKLQHMKDIGSVYKMRKRDEQRKWG